MNVALTFLALVALSYSAPQPRKLFHEHYEDFMAVINDEVGHELEHLISHYLEFEEFRATLNYIDSTDFQKLIYEMEDLPEFKAVVDFLESNDLDMQYFVDAFNAGFENVERGNLRHEVSGRDMSSFIKDCIETYPKTKLIALYEEKFAEDDEFRRAMESFETEEWDEVYSALWENETFLNEVATLKENGVDVELILYEYKAILGLNLFIDDLNNIHLIRNGDIRTRDTKMEIATNSKSKDTVARIFRSPTTLFGITNTDKGDTSLRLTESENQYDVKTMNGFNNNNGRSNSKRQRKYLVSYIKPKANKVTSKPEVNHFRDMFVQQRIIQMSNKNPYKLAYSGGKIIDAIGVNRLIALEPSYRSDVRTRIYFSVVVFLLLLFVVVVCCLCLLSAMDSDTELSSDAFIGRKWSYGGLAIFNSDCNMETETRMVAEITPAIRGKTASKGRSSVCSSVILDEAADDINHLAEHYLEFEEFQMSIDYLVSPKFRNLVYEMEDLPEFKAVVDFLETHDIDINYFIDSVNAFVDGFQKRTLRHMVSGRDMSAFIKDCIDEFPQAKLTALYEQKLAEDDQFRHAMESFETEEWNELYSALWENETFLNEVAILKENGIDVEIVLLEAKAILGISTLPKTPYKMKVAFVFLALVAACSSAPQSRVLFHEHFEDFMQVILDEVTDDLNHLLEHYLEFEEFQKSLDYLVTPNFRNLVYEMEDLPEFKAVVDFLQTHDIDINYFIDAINGFVDGVQRRALRHMVSGRDMSAFIKDSIDEFPQAKLTALYEQKLAEDDQFRHAMESFETEEWNELYSALWENETFLNEVAILKENGIDVEIVLLEAKAILGIY
ncbi:uncharacterized protein LOC126776175 [Nymphalis io]|uniref:uncharacterized protein LOC126776175 n=1 Tax=Inachis io TaxID=171585 RepID=UPI00216864B2|nr:uncharacterized protein LOC126776175 [Nymphalis io]